MSVLKQESLHEIRKDNEASKLQSLKALPPQLIAPILLWLDHSHFSEMLHRFPGDEHGLH